MGYKLIALDVDGTIRSHDRPTSERTRRTIQNVRDAGGIVTIATGRSYKSGASAASDVNLTAPIVTFQGAHVADPATGKVLWHVPLTSDMTAATLDALAGWDGVQAVGYLGDEIFVTELTEWARAYGERTGVGVRVVDSDEFTSRSMSRIVVHGEDEIIERLESSLKDRFNGDMYVTRSLPYFCEILHPSGGKDKALEWLCGHLGVSPDHTIAFGNGYNDVQMLEWARMSVAVGDAVEEVLEIADLVAPPMEEDGVAQVLDDLLERGLIG